MHKNLNPTNIINHMVHINFLQIIAVKAITLCYNGDEDKAEGSLITLHSGGFKRARGYSPYTQEYKRLQLCVDIKYLILANYKTKQFICFKGLHPSHPALITHRYIHLINPFKSPNLLKILDFGSLKSGKQLVASGKLRPGSGYITELILSSHNCLCKSPLLGQVSSKQILLFMAELTTINTATYILLQPIRMFQINYYCQ